MVQAAQISNDVSLRGESDFRILWVGSKLPKVRAQLDESPIEFAFQQVKNLADVPADSGHDAQYDCVVVNFQKDDHSQYLRFAMIMANRSFRKILVLAPSEKVDFLAALPGVACVFEKPATAVEVVEEINLAFSDREEFLEFSREFADDDPSSVAVSENATDSEASIDPIFEDEQNAEQDEEECDGQGDIEASNPVEPSKAETKGAVTTGFETSVSHVRELDRSIWRRFLPVVNFLYKKLAILALGSLFLTFIAYGAMIVFYLASSSWTLPFELSAGHKIVQKVERDLSQLRVSRNMFRQQLTVNSTELSSATRKQRQGKLQIDAIWKTINEEIYSQQREQRVLQKQIDRLVAVENKVVVARSESDLPDYLSTMQSLFKDQIVSRRAVEGVRLTLIEAEYRMANMRNEIATKREQLALSMRQERQLIALQEKVSAPEFSFAPITDSQFSYLVSDLMSARTAALAAKAEHSGAKERQGQLKDSLAVVTRNIEHVVKTPMARAIEKPVAVLFVPYQNSNAAKENDAIYGCRFFIFICRKVGQVGSRVDGETVASHPLFDKPMRGYFVEAMFDDPRSVTEELLHFGGAPALF